ncbi:hypothetical protein ACHAWO_010210 [Cyclotella atomus]|jgi:hypothetical protein|uniref:Uncharacterized protein n=1 Tax=Cyclotella atomus TaxID=382360 RepID=A0ABD3Q601_9STRA
MEDSIISIRAKLKTIRTSIERLRLYFQWMLCYGKSALQRTCLYFEGEGIDGVQGDSDASKTSAATIEVEDPQSLLQWRGMLSRRSLLHDQRHAINEDVYSTMFQLMVDHLYINFYNKISRVELCRRLVHNAFSTSALHETVYANGQLVDESLIHHIFLFESWRIFGFLDPKSWRCSIKTRELHHDIQCAFYSGYFKKHRHKSCQFSFAEIQHNDNTLQ